MEVNFMFNLAVIDALPLKRMMQCVRVVEENGSRSLLFESVFRFMRVEL